jgi:hypothetical protein
VEVDHRGPVSAPTHMSVVIAAAVPPRCATPRRQSCGHPSFVAWRFQASCDSNPGQPAAEEQAPGASKACTSSGGRHRGRSSALAEGWCSATGAPSATSTMWRCGRQGRAASSSDRPRPTTIVRLAAVGLRYSYAEIRWATASAHRVALQGFRPEGHDDPRSNERQRRGGRTRPQLSRRRRTSSPGSDRGRSARTKLRPDARGAVPYDGQGALKPRGGVDIGQAVASTFQSARPSDGVAGSF